MKLKNNISLKERIAFVSSVKDLCIVDGVVTYAVFDYAFRFMVCGYFIEGIDLNEMDENEISKFIYSKEYDNVLAENDGTLSAINSLKDACKKELEIEHDKYMVNYTAVYNPDPMGRIADAIEQIKKEAEPLLNEENVLKMLTQLYDERNKKAAKKTLNHKPPMKVVNNRG